MWIFGVGVKRIVVQICIHSQYFCVSKSKAFKFLILGYGTWVSFSIQIEILSDKLWRLLTHQAEQPNLQSFLNRLLKITLKHLL